MSQFNKYQFRLTFLAMAVLSLSACSTTSNSGGFDFGGIGDGLGKIGSKTAELGSNAWEGTKNVLNIGTPEPQNLDEVDLALMDDDAKRGNAQSGTNDVAEVQVAAAEREPVLPRNALKPNTASEENVQAFGQLPEPTKLLQPTRNANGELVVLSTDDLEKPTVISPAAPVTNAGSGSAALLDTTYEVSASENLWQIAKTTTGDANNWHVLADINNLGPNASVFAGQKLVIPADMIGTEYSKQIQPVTAASAQASVAQPATPGNTPTAGKKTAAVALNLPKARPESVLAAPGTSVAEAEQTPTAGATSETSLVLEVGAGETLWDFAKRTTGDATNWKTIAAYNEFDEQKLGLIRPGQEIYVPIDILRARDESGNLIAKGEELIVPNARVGGVAPKNELAIEATAAVLAGTNLPATVPPVEVPAGTTVALKSETAQDEIKIVEAAFQNESGIKPVTADSLAEEASLAVDSNNKKLGKVMVKGTYYPKAVYNNADFSSSLLMRVSPGTQLLVSKTIGPWLEVKTDKGVGYVHSRDIK